MALDNIIGNIPFFNQDKTGQQSTEKRSEYLENKTNPEHRGLANIEDFYFNPDIHKEDDNRSIIGHIYDRIDKSATPLSSSITDAKTKDQSYRDTITQVFKDKKTEYFKYGIYIDDSTHNEDPTVLGFDLVIDVNNSPLFTELPEFFKAFANIDEVNNRKDVYTQFLEELGRYFETGIPGSNSEFSSFKAHYIKSVSGLDLLGESISGGSFDEAGKKQFTDYGKDLLKVNLYEDVTLSTSHLALLYKTLMWSKISGRLVIPENLLRFDMYVQISEIRNFNAVKKSLDGDNGGEMLEVVRANVSRYVYKLYDCQLYFDKLPHGDQISIAESKAIDGFDFQIKYKFSTVQFERFMQQNDVINRSIGSGPNDLTSRTTDWETYLTSQRKYITNEDLFPLSVNISGYDDSSGTSSSGDPNMGNKAEYLIRRRPVEPQAYYQYTGQDKKVPEAEKQGSAAEVEKNTFGDKLKDAVSDSVGNSIESLKKSAMNLAKQKANELIGLVNSTLGKVLSNAGLGKGIYDPSNVYDKQGPLEKLVKSEFRKFGNSTLNSVLGVGQNELKNLFKR
jgi:hypothetical protein